MSKNSDQPKPKNPDNRYVNDLRRLEFSQRQSMGVTGSLLPITAAVFFLGIVAFIAGQYIAQDSSHVIILAITAMVGGYMALNIGANDVANNMGPAVGGKVITVTTAVIIAAIFESAGALLAGGDVVSTIAKGIIEPDPSLSVIDFRILMLSALLAAALWINLATWLNAPVSTTHSIVGGVLGAGIAAAGFAMVNWTMMASIAASWVISPTLGAMIAASLLYFIKVKILNVEDRRAAALRWVPVLIALMAGAFAAYMTLKGLKRIVKFSGTEIIFFASSAAILGYFLSKPYIQKKILTISNSRKDIYTLFNVPLIIGVSLLSFAHGANDVANAVGPLAAIVSTLEIDSGVASKAVIPIWVMLIGAIGISLGLALFGPRLIRTVGQKITRLNAPRAYCVALSSAITVLIASSLALPVSSTHIAIGAIFGVGFLREFLESPDRKKKKPNHKLNATSKDAFRNIKANAKRRLVRRNFVYTIAAAWVITVPSSAILAMLLFFGLRLL